MSIDVPGDFNEYKGTVLRLIASHVVNLDVDYRVTELYGQEYSPCSVKVSNTLESVNFPQNSELTTIQNYALQKCVKLSTIDLSPCEKLSTIGSFAFYRCYGLKSVVFPTSETSQLTKICKQAFAQSGLISVTIPKQVSTIEGLIFDDCKNLTSLEFAVGSAVTNFPKYTTTGTAITEFTIRKGVNSIITGAFERTIFLVTIKVEDGNLVYSSTPKNDGLICGKVEFFIAPGGLTGEYTVPDGITKICNLAFYYSPLTKIKLPQSLTEIVSFGFTGSSITEIVIPDKVTNIGWHAFGYCRNLTSVTLSKKLEILEKEAFLGCSFSKITLPEGITNIGHSAFAENPNLKEIFIPGSLKELGGNVLPDTEDLIITFAETSIFKYEAPYIMDKKETFISQYRGKEANFNAEIADSFTIIKNRAFIDKKNLVGINFTENSKLEKIESFAFSGCINLVSIYLPKNVYSLLNSSFNCCYSLQEVNFDSNLITIANNCFTSCSKLKIVDLSKTKVQEFSIQSFQDCVVLETVLLPPNVLYFKQFCFNGCHSLKTLTIPAEANIKDVEKGAFFKTKIESFVFPAGSEVKIIESIAFKECSHLSSVTFCNSITKIEFRAFAFTNLTSLELSSGISVIGDQSFENCPFLTTFTIPENSQLTDQGFGLGIFRKSTALKTIECKSTKFAIRFSALFTSDMKQILLFPPASDVNFLPLPGTLRKIANGAFIDCFNIYSVVIAENSVHTIGNNAFEGCNNMHYINIPSSVKFVGVDTFLGCYSLYCGIDVTSNDPQFLDGLIKVSKLPSRAVEQCKEIACKIGKSKSFSTSCVLSVLLLFDD